MFFITSILLCLVFLPVNFTVFQIFISAESAFLLSLGLCLVSILGCLLSSLKIKLFLYRIITTVVAITLAYIISGDINVFMLIISVICILIFSIVKMDINKGLTAQIIAAELIINIILSFLTSIGIYNISAKYINIAIMISTIALVILLIIKQTDDSRKFGSKNMRISNTQRKNNRIFAITSLIILFGISVIGQVQNIYGFIIKIFAWIIHMFGYLFGKMDSTAIQKNDKMPVFPLDTEQSDPSMLQKIIQVIIEVLIAIVVVAFVVFLIYLIIKTIFKLIKRIISWFKKDEKTVQKFYEDGHVDEKQSLYNKNLNNLVNNIRDKAINLFNRETPYHKLPNNIAKTRRLFKYFQSKAKDDGVQISKSSTSQEICNGRTDKIPETSEFNGLMSTCYAKARYGDIEPLTDELHELENKLL